MNAQSQPDRRVLALKRGTVRGVQAFFVVLFCLALWQHDIAAAVVFVVGYVAADLRLFLGFRESSR